ncbi:MAG: transposase [Candidatus Sericytochromatia bacterium]|nr:transposase [Candidatus Sericytochromatia bacterium]
MALLALFTDDRNALSVLVRSARTPQAVAKRGEIIQPEQQRKTKALRADFLAAPGHRIRCVDTPKHCGWLNQIELWFGILARAILQRGSFVSVAALTNAVLAFIRDDSQITARPYNWTYTGRLVGL